MFFFAYCLGCAFFCVVWLGSLSLGVVGSVHIMAERGVRTRNPDVVATTGSAVCCCSWMHLLDQGLGALWSLLSKWCSLSLLLY